MSDTFRKIKNRFMLCAVAISAAVGVCTGLAVVGIVLLSLKLNLVDLNAAYYVVIGCGAALLCGSTVFLILRPTDKKVARKLDKDFSLDERVQTMVEFAHDESEMAVLQRGDAEKAMKALPAKRPRPAAIAAFVLVPVVACAIFASGIIVPVRGEEVVEPPLPTDEFDLTEWQKTRLLQLISEVNSSALEEEIKQSVVTVLGDLLEALETAETGTYMKTQVVAAVTAIDGIIDGSNSYGSIAAVFSSHAATEDLGNAITQAALSYKADGEITSFEQVNQKLTELDETLPEILNTGFAAIETELSDLIAASSSFSTFTKSLKAYIDEYDAAFEELSVEYADGLFAACEGYFEQVGVIYSISAAGSGYGTSALLKELVSADGAFVSDAESALCVQIYKLMMKDYVRYALAEIFSITFDNSDGSGEDTDITDNDDGEVHDGGFGKGDSVYGSDDVVYSPDDDAYVEYGTVIDEYYAKIIEQTDGLPEELIKYINEYFDILYSGIQEEE